MDVSFTIATQTVSFQIAAVLINQTMIVNFSSVSDTLTSSFFVGKTLNDIVLIANGTEMITVAQCTKSSTASDTISLVDSLGGNGNVKAIVGFS
jgi:hypothetical protein